MAHIELDLIVLPGVFAICSLPGDHSIPEWATRGSFFSITKTPDELSIIVEEVHVPAGVRCERGWRALKAEGAFSFEATGILASLAHPLAEGGISIFALATYDTDYLFVKEEVLELAVEVLADSGHRVRR